MSRFECSILALKHQVFNSDFNVVTTPWGKSMHVDELSQAVSKDFLFAKLTIKQKVEKLDLSPEEEAILTGVVITFPGKGIIHHLLLSTTSVTRTPMAVFESKEFLPIAQENKYLGESLEFVSYFIMKMFVGCTR